MVSVFKWSCIYVCMIALCTWDGAKLWNSISKHISRNGKYSFLPTSKYCREKKNLHFLCIAFIYINHPHWLRITLTVTLSKKAAKRLRLKPRIAVFLFYRFRWWKNHIFCVLFTSLYLPNYTGDVSANFNDWHFPALYIKEIKSHSSFRQKITTFTWTEQYVLKLM